MKVIDVLRLMNGYDYVRIHAANDLEWSDDNPSLWNATKVSELGWLLVEKLSARNVIELASDWVEMDNETVSFLNIVYR